MSASFSDPAYGIYQMPPTPLLLWHSDTQEMTEQENHLPTRWRFFAFLVTDSPFLHASDPSLSDDCLICYRPFTARVSNRARVKLPCGHHHFCRKCLAKWAREGKNTCPCCREELWQLEPPRIISRLTNRSATRQQRNAILASRSSVPDTDQPSQTSNRSATRQRRNAIVALPNPVPSTDQPRQTLNSTWSEFRSITFGMFGSSAAMPTPTAPMMPFPRTHTSSSTIQELAGIEPRVPVARLIDHFNNLTTAAMQQLDNRPPPRGLFGPFRIRIRVRVTGL